MWSELLTKLPAERHLQRSPRERDSVSATLVTQFVTQALLINSGATVEKRSEKAEQWSG